MTSTTDLSWLPSALIAFGVGFVILIVAVGAWLRFKTWHMPVLVVLAAVALIYPFVDPGNVLPLFAAVAMVPVWTEYRNRFAGATFATSREALSHLGTALSHLFSSVFAVARGLLADVPGFWRKRGFWKGVGIIVGGCLAISLISTMLGNDFFQYVISGLWVIAGAGLFVGTRRLFLDGTGTVSLTRMFDPTRTLGLARAMKNSKPTIEMAGHLYTYVPNPLAAVGIDEDDAREVFDAHGVELEVFTEAGLRFRLLTQYAEAQNFDAYEEHDDAPAPVTLYDDDEVTL